jgi:hypothetical protein
MSSRPEFVADARFSASDLALEQQYRWDRARRHSRFLHGWGVVCGLQVVPANDPANPGAMLVCPGFAISPCGDEIEVRRRAMVDIANSTWALKTSAGLEPTAALVAIRYVTNDERLGNGPGRHCYCTAPQTRLSRIADSFRVDLLPDADVSAPQVDLCGQEPSACSAAPAYSPYVPLARILLPGPNRPAIGVIDVTGVFHPLRSIPGT